MSKRQFQIKYEASRNCVSKLNFENQSVPCGRYGHKSVVWGSKMIMYGGFNGDQRLNQTYCFNLDQKKWIALETKGCDPGKRDCHSASIYRDRMIVFGGGNGKDWLNDMLSFDIKNNRWDKMKQKGQLPSKRAGHTTIVYKNQMLLFGGWSGRKCLNDLYSFDFTTSTWTQLQGNDFSSTSSHLYDENKNRPKPRDSHQTVLWKDYMIVIGGGDGHLRIDQMHMYDIKNNTWKEIKYQGIGKLGRAGHICVMNEKENKIIMFGGGDGNIWIQDVFEFDFATFTWKQLSLSNQKIKIPSSYGASGVQYRNKMIIFGGGDGESWFNDVYEYRIDKECNGTMKDNLFQCQKFGSFQNIIIKCKDKDEIEDEDEEMEDPKVGELEKIIENFNSSDYRYQIHKNLENLEPSLFDRMEIEDYY